MKLSTRTRYGMRAMIDIALNSSTGPILLKDICRRQELSFKYLDHIITSLKLARLVRSIRGKNGGYVLTRKSDEIYASEIVLALEGSLSFSECIDSPESCNRTNTCAAHKLWDKAKKAFEKSLRIKLSILAE